MSTPTVVQYVNTGWTTTNCGTAPNPWTLKIPLPNATLPGNVLILGFQFADTMTFSSVTDDLGNVWTTGPSNHNAVTGGWIFGAYCLNPIPGTRTVSIALSGANVVHYTSATLVEVAFLGGAAAALDVSIAQSTDTASPYNTGAITTTVDGDYIFEYAATFGNTSGALSRIVAGTAGSGFTLLGANVNPDYGIAGLGSMAQHQVWASHGSINPDFTTVGDTTAIWASMAMAFKATTVGTLATKMPRIIGVHHQNMPEITPFQCPYMGTSLIGLYNDDAALVSTITDSAGNTWSVPSDAKASVLTPEANAQGVYALNLTPNADLRSITFTLNAVPSGHPFIVLYDCIGLISYDVGATATGKKSALGVVTTVTITPAAVGGLVFGNISESEHDCQSIVGGDFVFDSVTDNTLDDANGSANSPLDEDNGNAHINVTSTKPITFIWQCNGTTGIGNWASIAMSFLAAAPSLAPFQHGRMPIQQYFASK